MFKPQPMIRVNALVLKRDERGVLYGLGRAGVVHLSRTQAGPSTAPLDPPDKGPDMARCAALLQRLNNLHQALELTDLPPGDQLASVTLDQVDQRLAEVEEQLEQLIQRKTTLERQWTQVTTLLDQIVGYQGLELPLEQLRRSSFLHFALGTLPTQNVDEVRESAGDNVVLLPLHQQQTRQTVVAITSRKGRFALETALKQSGFRDDNSRVEDIGQTATLADQSRAEQARLADDLRTLRSERQQLATRAASQLAGLEQVIRDEHTVLAAQQNFPHTGTAILITGWVPADQAAVVEAQLHHVCGERCVIRMEDPDDVPTDQIPVLLRQPRLLRPFTSLVAGFGLPGYRDLEPTLLVAISYMLMFGIMFGDVGHGGLLTLGGIVTMLAAREDKIRDYGLLVLMAGVSSMLVGVLYGSYFGIPALNDYALWHEPLHAPVQLMLITIGVGIAMISLGVVLNMINLFRRGDLLSGLLDKFGLVGVIFYWCSLIFIIKYAALSELGLAGLVLVVGIALPLLAVTLKEPLQYALSKRAGHVPHSDNLMMACIESLIEAFEAALTYLANTISFVRLAAYAMSHAAILMATYAVADAAFSINGVGGVLYVATVICGNAIALVLEGIVVAVQVLRLEYYEFFSKFFPGTGLPFRPFSFLGREKETI